MGVFGGIEWAVHETEKKNHKAIVAATADLDRLGYLIQGIKVDGGRLEVTCCPPRKEEGMDEAWVGISSSPDKSGKELFLDGVSETCKA